MVLVGGTRVKNMRIREELNVADFKDHVKR